MNFYIFIMELDAFIAKIFEWNRYHLYAIRRDLQWRWLLSDWYLLIVKYIDMTPRRMHCSRIVYIELYYEHYMSRIPPQNWSNYFIIMIDTLYRVYIQYFLYRKLIYYITVAYIPWTFVLNHNINIATDKTGRFQIVISHHIKKLKMSKYLFK